MIGTRLCFQLPTYDLRNVSGMRSVAVGSSGNASAGAALPNRTRNRDVRAMNLSAGFGDFGGLA